MSNETRKAVAYETLADGPIERVFSRERSTKNKFVFREERGKPEIVGALYFAQFAAGDVQLIKATFQRA